MGLGISWKSDASDFISTKPHHIDSRVSGDVFIFFLRRLGTTETNFQAGVVEISDLNYDFQNLHKIVPKR